MKDELVSFQVAKLAKEKGFDWECSSFYESSEYLTNQFKKDNWNQFKLESAPTQSMLQRFIREKRGVHIEIHRNASGYYWSMCKSVGGTDLGWSDHTGIWDSFEDALENALQVQLSYDLPNDTKVIKHWGNYVEFTLKKSN